GGIISHAQCRDVNRRIEEQRLHLRLQRGVDIFDGYAAFHEALVGFRSQPVALVFRNHQIQGSLNGLGFGAGAQHLLCALDFHGVQTKVLMCSRLDGGHPIVLLPEYTIAMYTMPPVVNMLYLRQSWVELFSGG